MLATNHVLTGSTLALILKRPELVLPVSFASHFICDALPHTGFKNKSTFLKIAKIDGVILLLYFFLLYFSFKNYTLLLGAFFALLPDFDKPYEYFIGSKTSTSLFPKRFNDFHGKIQRESTRYLFVDIFVFISLNIYLFIYH